jgi:hypothetical protein
MVWLSAAVFVLVLALLSRLRRRPLRVTLDADDEGIRRTVGETSEGVRWDELLRVQIITTDEGPFVDDVYWLFLGPDEKGCVVENAHIDDRVLSRIAKLPNVDYAAVIMAMGSAENASFLVWSRPDAAAPTDAVSPPLAD